MFQMSFSRTISIFMGEENLLFCFLHEGLNCKLKKEISKLVAHQKVFNLKASFFLVKFDKISFKKSNAFTKWNTEKRL